MKPVPTIFDPKKVINKNSEINNVTSQICIPRRTPGKRLYQEDQYESFISKDSVKYSKCLNESFSPSGYTFRTNDDHILFYKKTKCRSSHRRCSVRKGVLRNFAKFTGKHLCQSLFFNKVAGLQLY